MVGLPGETIEIRAGELVVDGVVRSPPTHVRIGPYQSPQPIKGLRGAGPVRFPFVVPDGHYFVLGDNVSNALDSRFWGGLDGSKIVAKVPGK